MKRLFGLVFLFGLSLYVHAQVDFDPDFLKFKYLGNMPLREYNEWAGNKYTCSQELYSAISAIAEERFDLYEFFQITDIGGNDTLVDDHFWSYIFNNYETIIGATLSAGDVNIFLAPVEYFSESNISDGYFLVSRYNGGNKKDPNSYRLFLYYYQVQWY
jgi:hypothetical protein